MNKFKILLILLAGIITLNSCSEDKLKALIVTGQNTHNWAESHIILEEILENSEMFKVDLAISPASGEDMSSFNPDFSSYDLVVMDYTGDYWSEECQNNFENYVTEGGGVVVYHASSSSFPEWEAYNKICGIGGWNGRNEASGPYVYWTKDGIVKDEAPGIAGSHGPAHEFMITHREPEHPILKGLPEKWMHAADELYGMQRGPALNLSVLATAYSDPKKEGSAKHEPMLFTVKYGKGRIFHTAIGHVGEERPIAAQCAGFIITLQRGAEWAATGMVTQAIPEDLPNIATPLIQHNYKAYTNEELFERSKSFEYGKSEKYLRLISGRIRNAMGDTEKLAQFEKMIIRSLESDASVDTKNYLCRELSWMGTEKSIKALEKLKADKATKTEATFALESITTK